MNHKSFYYDLLDLSNIQIAVDLAIHARTHLDPFFDPFELKNNSKEDIVKNVKKILSSKRISLSGIVSNYTIFYSKNLHEIRSFNYTDITSYSIKFLISYLLFKKQKLPNCIFGGKDEIFTFNSGDVFGLTGYHFGNWQKGIINSGNYDWVVISDISDYYNKININTLINKIIKIIGNECDEKTIKILNAFIKKVSVGDWCDHFLQNIFLLDLDAQLTSEKWEYSRMTDDFRIFCKTESDSQTVFNLLSSSLKDINLKVNEDKMFVIRPPFTLGPLVESIDNLDDMVYESISDDDIKYLYSPYIELKNISEYDIENLKKLIGTSSGEPACYEDIFRQDVLPKKITLKENIDGKSGFKLENMSIELLLNKYGKSKTFDDHDFINMLRIIRGGFGNYRFYYRIFYTYLDMLTKTDDIKSIKYGNLLLQGNLRLKDSTYFKYLSLRILFFDNYKELIPALNKKNPHFQDDLLSYMTKSLLDGDYFLLIVVKFLIVNEFIKLNITVTKEYWQDDIFWQKLIDDHLEKAPYLDDKNIAFLKFMTSWLPNSQLIKYFKAECLYYSSQVAGLDIYLSLIQNEAFVKRYNLYFKIANCYKKNLNELDNALKYYSMEIDLTGAPFALNNLALIKHERNDLDGALKDFSSALQKEKNSIYYLNRAGIYSAKGDLLLALKDLDEYESYDPSFETAKLKASLYKKFGNYSKCIETIESFYRSNTNGKQFITEMQNDIAEIFTKKELDWPFTYIYFLIDNETE